MSSPETEDLCCVVDAGERCMNVASHTTFSKKMKLLAQKKQKLFPDPTVIEIAFTIYTYIYIYIYIYIYVYYIVC